MNTTDKMLPEDIGTRVKQRRLMYAWTQEDLAKHTGLTVETISRIEKGKNEPRPSTVRKLAEALDVPVLFFTRPSDDREL